MSENFEETKKKMWKKFQELKKKGKETITIADIMTDKQKEEFNKRIKEKSISITPEDLNVKSFDKVYPSELVFKYFDKLLQLPKVGTVSLIDDNSIIFEFGDKKYHITYDKSSLCMVINEGEEFDDDEAREIGYYELVEKFI